MKYAPVRWLLIVGILWVVIQGQRYEQSAHAAWLRVGIDPVKVAVVIDKPAVVRIYSSVVGRLIVHFPTGDVEFPQNAQGYALTLSGSGTFVSSHGDILTADHLITPPSQVFADVAAIDVTDYINQHGTFGRRLTVDQVDLALASSQIRSDVVYSSKSSEVYLSTDYTGPLSATSLQTLPAATHRTVDSIETESPFAQADVAIVHAPFIDTPGVQLADSSQVQQLDDLIIVGFPGNGDVSDSPNNLLTSSVNRVTVSAIKTTATGAPLIQVGGNVEHGDSGGPVIDGSGRIVGIVSFTLSAGSPGETSFLQASNSARILIQALDLNTTPGTFQQEWSHAFTDYAAATPGHWHKALRELTTLAAAYPLFQAVTPYLVIAQAQAKAERIPQAPVPSAGTSSPGPSITVWLTSLAWIAGALVLLVLLFFLLREIAGYLGRKGISALSKAQSQGVRSPHLHLARGGSQGGATQPTSAPTQDHRVTSRIVPTSGPQQRSSRMPLAQAVMGMSLPASTSGALLSWPCGHANRRSASFCSTCGEPAPPLPQLLSAEQ